MNDSWPLVSVVVPVFNAEPYIEACLQSILSQDYPSLQVIVVDDGSTDATAERVRRTSREIVYRRQPNSGSAIARNLGIDLAEGDYVAFNDSDDLWAPNRLKQQVAFLRGQSEYHAVCGRFMSVPDDFTLDDAAQQSYEIDAVLDPTLSGWTYFKLLEESIYHLDALLVRREVLQRVRFNPDYRRGQDFDFFLQLVNATPIAQLSNLYAFYRQNPTSITRKPHVRNYRAEIVNSALERWGWQDRYGQRLKQEKLDDMLARSWFSHGYEHYSSRWYRTAEKSFRNALRHDPGRWSIYRYLLVGWLMRPWDRSPAPASGR